jgi:hypothetical protein
MTPNGIAAANERRFPSIVKLACGLQKPSFESDVGIEKKGSLHKNATYLAISNALPPPTATIAVG